MAQSFQLREQAARCRRLARDGTDASLRDRLLELAGEYTARAGVLDRPEAPFRNAGSGDRGAN
jgi:hypothetical protein